MLNSYKFVAIDKYQYSLAQKINRKILTMVADILHAKDKRKKCLEDGHNFLGLSKWYMLTILKVSRENVFKLNNSFNSIIILKFFKSN